MILLLSMKEWAFPVMQDDFLLHSMEEFYGAIVGSRMETLPWRCHIKTWRITHVYVWHTDIPQQKGPQAGLIEMSNYIFFKFKLNDSILPWSLIRNYIKSNVNERYISVGREAWEIRPRRHELYTCAFVFSLRTIQTVPLVQPWPLLMSWATISGWIMIHWRGAVAVKWRLRKEAASWTLPPGKYPSLPSALRVCIAWSVSWEPDESLVFWSEHPGKLPKSNSFPSSKSGLCYSREPWAARWQCYMVQGLTSSLRNGGDGCCLCLEIVNYLPVPASVFYLSLRLQLPGSPRSQPSESLGRVEMGHM